MIATLSAASLVAAGAFGVSTRSIVLLTTGSFVLVYVLGTAAAVKLLPRRSWSRRSAVVALASSLALLVMAGPYLLWPLGLAAVALVYLAGRTWRTRRRPEPVLAAPFPIVEPGVCPRR